MVWKFTVRNNSQRITGGWGLCMVFLAVLGCSFSSATASDGMPAPADTKAAVAYNAPGRYLFANRCLYAPQITIEMVQIGGAPGQPINLVPVTRFAMLTVCVTGVTVREDRQMQFDIQYTLAPMEDETSEVWRESDRDNRNVFLTDDRGGRYEFLEVGGCAAQEMRTQNEDLQCTGWFLFPPAEPDATSFDFHYATADTTENSGNDVMPGIVLTAPG
jgi:hypothetical protein